MSPRLQKTIERCAEVSGVGFLTGADVTLRFCPAGEDHGIVFQRIDHPSHPVVPATIDYTVFRSRRTAVAQGDAQVEMVEHVLAALAGLHIDNCLVQLNAPEPPGCDGSAEAFATALLDAGLVDQTQPRMVIPVESECRVVSDDGESEVAAQPLIRPAMTISYQLDYGFDSPIPPQMLAVDITPQTFLDELAFARTFILETEVEALKAQGYGKRVTTSDLLVFGDGGVIGNRLRARDECVRHKILDCVGDFALLGCDLHGQFTAYRSGHELNRDLIRRIADNHRPSGFPPCEMPGAADTMPAKAA